MKNIYNYLKEYGNITFKEKTLNNIDYSILSLLSYLDFTNLMENETIPLQDALRRFKRDVSRSGNLQEAKKRQYYLKPSDVRKQKRQEARKKYK